MQKLLFALLLLLTTFLTPTAKADWHGHGGWGHGGWGYHQDFGGGNAAVGGFLGGLAGTIFGNIMAPPAPPVVVQQPPVVVMPAPSVPEIQPWTGPWYAWCAQKYHTFDATSGTYMGFDGQRHLCG